MRAWFRTLLILTLVAGLQACTAREDDKSSSESRLNQATEHIDKSEYSEAIAILEDLKSSDASEKVRMVLASAYAGRAGVKVENYWGFVVTYKPLLKGESERGEEPLDPLVDVSLIPQSAPKEVREGLRRLNENMREIMRIRRRIERIPHITREQRLDLQRGVNALDGVATQGGYLYRAILEVVLLRSSLDEVVSLASNLLDDPGASACTSKARKFVEWLRYSQGTLGNTLKDLGGAYPNDRDNLEKIRRQITSFEIPSTERVCGSEF